LPLIFIDLGFYESLFTSYIDLLSSDHDRSYGLSVMGCLHSWLGWEGDKNIVVFIGIILFMIPFVKIEKTKSYRFRLIALSSILLWNVIFNHKAESPTFIIAVAGAAIWFFSGNRSPFSISLIVLCFVLSSLSSTDLFPKIIRTEWIKPYSLKVLPCILIWLMLIGEMIGISVSNPNRKKLSH